MSKMGCEGYVLTMLWYCVISYSVTGKWLIVFFLVLHWSHGGD